MITDLLERGTDNAPAIIGSDTEPLRYGALRTHIESVVSTLNGYGLGSRDRVAIVLPNGPQMASAFVSIAAGATAAPLNPAYRADEFNFFLSDLRASALVLMAESDSPARNVAKAQAIPIIELEPDKDIAGFLRYVRKLWSLRKILPQRCQTTQP